VSTTVWHSLSASSSATTMVVSPIRGNTKGHIRGSSDSTAHISKRPWSKT
jgi:hypothetical protein